MHAFKWLGQGQPFFPDRGVDATPGERALLDEWRRRDPLFFRWVARESRDNIVGIDLFCPSWSSTPHQFIERAYFEVPQRYPWSTISGVHWVKYVLWTVQVNCFPPVPPPPPPLRLPALRAPRRRPPALRAPPPRCPPGFTFQPSTGLCVPPPPVVFARPAAVPLFAATTLRGLGQQVQLVNFEQGKRYMIEYLYSGVQCSTLSTQDVQDHLVGTLGTPPIEGLGFTMLSNPVVLQHGPNDCVVSINVERSDPTTYFDVSPAGPFSGVPNAELDAISELGSNMEVTKTLFRVCVPPTIFNPNSGQCESPPAPSACASWQKRAANGIECESMCDAASDMRVLTATGRYQCVT